MSILPENLKRYQKFALFILKYRNSEIFNKASENALSDFAEEDIIENEDYSKPEELVEDLKNMGPTYVKNWSNTFYKTRFNARKLLESLRNVAR